MNTLEAARKLMSERGWLSNAPPSFSLSVLTRCASKGSTPARQSIQRRSPGRHVRARSGALSVSVVQGERGPYFAHFFGPGDSFGERPAISGRARIVGLSAVRETEMLYLSLRSVDDILREQPASWRLFAALTLGKLEVAMWAIDDLMSVIASNNSLPCSSGSEAVGQRARRRSPDHRPREPGGPCRHGERLQKHRQRDPTPAGSERAREAKLSAGRHRLA